MLQYGRYFILFAIVCVSLFMPGVGHAEGHVVIGFEDYPPYEYQEGGEARGMNMDIMKEAFLRIGVKPEFKFMPWKRAIREVRDGGIVGLASGFKTPERETFALFPEPLAVEEVYVVAPTVSGVEVNSLDDLRSLTVGVVRGYAYGHDFDVMVGLKKIEAASNSQLLKMLSEQRMDVAIMNKAVAKHFARKMGKIGHIRFAFAVNSEPLYLMFSREHSASEALSSKFGEAVRSMKRDGTFDAIVSRY